MKTRDVINHIVNWLDNYCEAARMHGFVIGVSGGIDSAVTSTLCALTKRQVMCLNMPIHQSQNELSRSLGHIDWLKNQFSNVQTQDVLLSKSFDTLSEALPDSVQKNDLALANTRSRLRMLTLYAIGQDQSLLVAGTGNKVEDFGIGFYTKYGDGGVDISPIADLMKSEVYSLGQTLGINEDILIAPPTDGLWSDGRTDEDAIGATYDELEWAMMFSGPESELTTRQMEILDIYRRYHSANKHKMEPIPVCSIPDSLR